MANQTPTAPTTAQFGAYQAMFDWFNRKLFDDKLPRVILNFSRKRNANGFFLPHPAGMTAEP